MTRTSPTSVGRFSSNGKMCFSPAFAESFFACAAALMTENRLINASMVGAGEREMILAVDVATPSYF